MTINFDGRKKRKALTEYNPYKGLDLNSNNIVMSMGPQLKSLDEVI